MIVPLLVAAFAGSMLSEVAESSARAARQEAVAARVLSAGEIGDDPVTYLHHVCTPLERVCWADRWWYQGHFTLNEEVEADLICPTRAQLFVRFADTGVVAIFAWDEVNSISFGA